MPTYVALLRSVNVAGHGRITMGDLRQTFTALGYRDIETYIQTGNVIFSTPGRNMATLSRAITGQLEADFGRAPAVIVRSAADMVRIAATSPFAARGADPARHHVTFLSEAPDPRRLATFSPPPSGRDELTIIGREVYVHTPDGYADTKLTGTYIERHLGVTSTTRNWNSVSKLRELVGG